MVLKRNMQKKGQLRENVQKNKINIRSSSFLPVILEKAGTQKFLLASWIPGPRSATPGMTKIFMTSPLTPLLQGEGSKDSLSVCGHTQAGLIFFNLCGWDLWMRLYFLLRVYKGRFFVMKRYKGAR
jgi:hypothetical protein